MRENPYLKLSPEEIQRRLDALDVLENKEQSMPSKSANPYLNLSEEEIIERLKQLEPQGEALTTEEGLQAYDPNLMDRLKQLGQGAAHGAYEGAKFLSHIVPPSPQGLLFPEDQQKLNDIMSRYEQQYEQGREATDPTGRTLMNAGSFAGSMAIPLPISGPANLAKQGYKAVRHKTPFNFAELVEKFSPKPVTASSIKSAAKTGATASGLGAISGVAQELGVDPLTADLGTIFAAPLAGRALGKAGSSLKQGFSEEGRNQSKNERLLKQIGQEFLKTPDVTAKSINLEHNLKPFDKTADVEHVGSLIKEKISDKLGMLEGLRAQKTAPLYKEAEESKNFLQPNNFLSFIEEKLPNLYGSIKDDFVKYTSDLKGKSSSEINNILNENASPELVALIKNKKNSSASKGFPLPFLDSVEKNLNDKISNASKEGKKEKARLLYLAKEELKKDFLSHPLGKERSRVYAENSTEINKIERSILGRLLKTKDKYGIEDVIKDEDAIKSFLKGRGSREAARTLKDVLGDDKRLNKTIIKGINDDFLTQVKNKDGGYSPSAIHNYIKSNAGAEILYPGFKQKAKNLANAQQLSDDLRKLYSSSNFLKDNPATSLSGYAFRKFARNIPFGDKIWDAVASVGKENKKKTIADLAESILSDVQQAEAAFKKTPKPKSTILPQFAKYSKGAIPSFQKNKDSDQKK